MISLRNVSKRFGQQVILNDVSLEIRPGQTTTIIGPSGAGKSVTLKLIMGIMQPDAGEIFIDGENISAATSETERNRIREKLGVLFQSAALFDSLNVYDNIAFPLRERSHLPESEVHPRVVEMVEALSLEPYLSRLPQQISVGVRKRVGMARCLITRPQILLVDEPNTGLDPFVGQEVYDLIKESKARWGFTGVVVSHELPEVFQISDRVAMLLRGRFVAEGSPHDLLRSQDPAVQQFLQGKKDGPITIH